jgi:hypothetical protein
MQPVADVRVFEFLHQLGIGLGVAIPFMLGGKWIVKTLLKSEMTELKAAIQSELDARTIEFRDSHVTISEFGRCQKMSNESSLQITRRLEGIEAKLDRLLFRLGSNSGSHEMARE